MSARKDAPATNLLGRYNRSEARPQRIRSFFEPGSAPRMTARNFALALVVVVILIYIGFRANSGKSTTSSPGHSQEVYLLYQKTAPSPGPEQASAAAQSYGGVLATPGQVASYQAAGGETAWYGATSLGIILSAPSDRYSLSVLELPAGCNVPHGAWVYGPKPGAQSSDIIAPFSSSSWYQP